MKKLRLFENFHVVLWLVKDTFWLMHFRVAGTLMIAPTLAMALFIAWRTRKSAYLFLPNVAVCCWISANITWMLGEFYLFDFVWLSATFFGGGIVLMAWYFYENTIGSNAA